MWSVFKGVSKYMVSRSQIQVLKYCEGFNGYLDIRLSNGNHG